MEVNCTQTTVNLNTATDKYLGVHTGILFRLNTGIWTLFMTAVVTVGCLLLLLKGQCQFCSQTKWQLKTTLVSKFYFSPINLMFKSLLTIF